MDTIRLLAAGIRGSMDAGTWDETRAGDLAEAWDEFTVFAAIKMAREAGSFAGLFGPGEIMRAA